MFYVVMSVAKIKISQIDRKRHRRAQHSDRVVPVNREIGEHEERADRTAFPETKRNHALSRPLRCDPLDQKSQSENDTSAQPHDLPEINRDSKNLCFRE